MLQQIWMWTKTFANEFQRVNRFYMAWSSRTHFRSIGVELKFFPWLSVVCWNGCVIDIATTEESNRNGVHCQRDDASQHI
jgi:hypothetical protein